MASSSSGIGDAAVVMAVFVLVPGAGGGAGDEIVDDDGLVVFGSPGRGALPVISTGLLEGWSSGEVPCGAWTAARAIDSQGGWWCCAAVNCS